MVYILLICRTAIEMLEKKQIDMNVEHYHDLLV